MPLSIVRNDITHMNVDAIVNAANHTLLGGGGVDGAIHRAAGPGLLEACRALNGCETGQAKLTPGFALPCRYVIHTVGPIWRGGKRGEPELLAACYRNSLALAAEYHCESVAFPLISAGVYGYPKAEALHIAVREITRFLMDNDMMVYIVVFGREAVMETGKLFGEIRAYIDDVYVEAHTDEDRLSQRRRFLEDAWSSESLAPGRGAPFKRRGREAEATDDALPRPVASPPPSLDDMLARMDEGFSEMLLRKIDESHMTDAECYRRANIDRRLFNKIKNNPAYHPGKQTVLAFAIALRLSLDETREMLSRAGFSLTHSSKSDIVVEYCILNGIYDIFEINQVLFNLDLQPLGY